MRPLCSESRAAERAASNTSPAARETPKSTASNTSPAQRTRDPATAPAREPRLTLNVKIRAVTSLDKGDRRSTLSPGQSGCGEPPSQRCGGCWGDDGRGVDTVAAVFFGLVERVVGAAHHGLDGGAVVGVAGDPEACGGVPVEAQDVGVGDRGGHLFREDARAVEVGGGEHYDELVAAKSGDEVAGAHRLRQGGCDHREQLIAAVMAKRVVDVLE